MYRFVLTGVLSVLVVSSSGALQPHRLTEAEYLSVLDESHPKARQAAAGVSYAEARLSAARALENPVAAFSREDPSGSTQQTDLSLSWKVPDLAARSRVKAEQQQLQVEQARFRNRHLALRLTMRGLYAEWALTSERARRLSVQASRVERLAEREGDRAERGEASGLQAHRLRLAASALRARATLATAATARARGLAAAWHPGMTGNVEPELPVVPATKVATGVSDQVQAATAAISAAEFDRQAAGRFVLSPEVSLGWVQEETGLEQIEGPTVGVSWAVPLFQRKQAARQRADASLLEARAQLQFLQQEEESTRSAAWESFKTLASGLDQVRQQLSARDRILDAAESAFLLGEAELTDLLEIHRSVTEAELAMLDLHDEALHAHRELERLQAVVATTVMPAPRTDRRPVESQPLETLP